MVWSKSKCLSVVVAKTASGNIAFKEAKTSEAELTGQSSVLTREVEGQSAPIDKATLEDLGGYVYF